MHKRNPGNLGGPWLIALALVGMPLAACSGDEKDDEALKAAQKGAEAAEPPAEAAPPPAEDPALAAAVADQGGNGSLSKLKGFGAEGSYGNGTMATESGFSNYQAPADAPDYYWVQVDAVNIRAKPMISSEKVGVLPWGRKVAVFGETNGFVHIGAEMYVSRRMLTDRKSQWNPRHGKGKQSKPEGPSDMPIANAGSFRVRASTLNVRAEPSTAGAVVGSLAAGSIVAGKPAAGGWIEIQPGQYVSGAFLEPTTEAPMAH